MVNYYTLLEIDETSDEESVSQAIKKARRAWNQRSTHPKQEIRAEAEQKIREIAEAEKILLDKDQRNKYNQKLASQVPEPSYSGNAPQGGKNWLELAVQYINSGDYSSAEYAAREATQQQPGNADAWYWKGVASLNLGNMEDANFAIHEAIRINPNNDLYYVELGDLYRTNSKYNEALPFYEKANGLNGNNYYILTCIAACRLGLGNSEAALPLAEQAYIYNKNDEFSNYIYSAAICNSIGQAWSGGTTITNLRQLDYSKEQLKKLREINSDDADIAQMTAEISQTVQEAEEVKFRSLRYGILSGWEYNARRMPQALRRTGLQ